MESCDSSSASVEELQQDQPILSANDADMNESLVHDAETSDSRDTYSSTDCLEGVLVHIPDPEADAPPKRREIRVRLFSQEQTRQLKHYFSRCHRVSRTEARVYATELGMTPSQVRTWFTNRRNRLKQELLNPTRGKKSGKLTPDSLKNVTQPSPQICLSSPLQTKEASLSIDFPTIDSPPAMLKEVNESPSIKFSPKLRALLTLPVGVSCSERNMQPHYLLCQASMMPPAAPSLPPPPIHPTPAVELFYGKPLDERFLSVVQQRNTAMDYSADTLLEVLAAGSELESLLSTATQFFCRSHYPYHDDPMFQALDSGLTGGFAMPYQPSMGLDFPELESYTGGGRNCGVPQNNYQTADYYAL